MKEWWREPGLVARVHLAHAILDKLQRKYQSYEAYTSGQVVAALKGDPPEVIRGIFKPLADRGYDLAVLVEEGVSGLRSKHPEG